MTTTIGLAPMEGVSTFPTRLFFHLAAAPAAMATPFLRVTGTFPARALPAAYGPELGPLRGALPYDLVPQLMAATADDFLRAAAFFPAPAWIELNAGCPSPTCVGKGAGSSMLRDPGDFHRAVERLVSGCGAGRVGVKMRTGFHSAAEFPALVAGLASLPLARLTVHGRTHPDGYRGRARWDLIDAARREVGCPVFGSGDVVDAPSLARLCRVAPGLAGLIIGRGALRNPWIFAELRTGHPIALPPRTVTLALRAFATLQDLATERLETLIELVAAGRFATPCGTEPEAWSALCAELDQVAYRHAAPPLSRHTLGRVKMLWSYLRSSLPAAYFEPAVLRQRDLTGLLAAIDARAAALADPRAPLPLRHAAELDWLYAGERRPEALALAGLGSGEAGEQQARPRGEP